MKKQSFILRAFQAIKNKFPLILIITVLITILGGVFSWITNEESYESTVTFTFGVELNRDTEKINPVTGEPIKESYIQFGTHRVYNESFQFFKELLSSEDLLDEVNNNLNLDLTNNELEDSIRLVNPEGSGILNLTVQMSDNKIVDKVATEVASTFIRKNIEITDLENLKVINTASNPKLTNSVNIKRNILISVILGFVLGIILILILTFFDSIQENKHWKS